MRTLLGILGVVFLLAGGLAMITAIIPLMAGKGSMIPVLLLGVALLGAGVMICVLREILIAVSNTDRSLQLLTIHFCPNEYVDAVRSEKIHLSAKEYKSVTGAEKYATPRAEGEQLNENSG